MRLLVIGTFIRDKISALNGNTRGSLGGISHTLSAMMAEADDDILVPISYVGNDLKHEVQSFLERDGRIDPRGICYVPRPNNTVELTYVDDQERIEKSLHPLPEIDIGMIRPLLDADAVIINMISGWEISLQTLQQLRREFPNSILMDFHSLSLGRREDGTRYLRPVADYKEWINCCNAVQMNALEFENLQGDLKNPKEFMMRLGMPESLLLQITLGDAGSLTIIRNNQYLRSFKTNAATGLNIIDPTGCGDVYLGGFAMSYLKSGDPEQAARRANLIAGIAGSVAGLADPQYLKEHKQAIWN